MGIASQRKESSSMAQISKEKTMEIKKNTKRKVCQACGYRGTRRAIVIHPIVFEETAEQTMVSGGRTALLCTNCRIELMAWYSRKISWLTYDSRSKRYIPRSREEMAREYEATFEAFIKYKKRVHRTG